MHLTARSHVLLVLTALLAVAGLWSGSDALRGAWMLPGALWIAGLAAEAWWVRGCRLQVRITRPAWFALGRAVPVQVEFSLQGGRCTRLEWLLPPTTALEADVTSSRVLEFEPQREQVAAEVVVTPVRLGEFAWPALPVRLRGRFGLADWVRRVETGWRDTVRPDLLGTAQRGARGQRSGVRARQGTGDGSDLQQLRDYVPGDPLSRVAWKRSARHGRLLTREFSDERQLDLLIVIDTGLRSGARVGRLDRLGTHVNLAARFAQSAVARDDRVGLLLYADRPGAALAPSRGDAALLRLRQSLGAATAAEVESDPLAAALRARALLRQRSLVVWLSDIDEPGAVNELARVSAVLTPPHLVVHAGLLDTGLRELLERPVVTDDGAWNVLAAGEHAARVDAGLRRLQRLGAPVVAAAPAQLEAAVLREYETLRRRRRVS